jgi:hypothetical protein
MKRKFDSAKSSGSALGRAIKKMKGSGSASHAHSSPATDAADDNAEDYRPSAYESEEDVGEATDSDASMEHRRLNHRKMTDAEKDGKQRRLEDQVISSF